MTLWTESEQALPWQRRVTLWVAGFLLLLALVFIILWQLRSPVVNRYDVTYLSVISVKESVNPLNSVDSDFDLKEPPERMFYQYASVPVDEKEAPLQALTADAWQGWESLAALKAPESVTTFEAYRLNLQQSIESENATPSSKFINAPDFRTIVVNGVPVQPVEVVPEPSSALLLVLSSLLVWRRRRA